MENFLGRINLFINKLFDLMQQACSFCYEKLSVFLNHAFSWAIVLSIAVLLLFNLVVLFFGGNYV